jgi:hypothetical protein
MASFVRQPSLSTWILRALPESARGHSYLGKWELSINDQRETRSREPEASFDSRNPLRQYFDLHQTGRGIWKVDHYFEIYHRHFKKFIGQEVHIVEVGVYSGGSLEMWKEYFGPWCRVYGVDVNPACKAYEADRIKILIGDQGDRRFWESFRKQVPSVDVLVDDGGHLPEQQIVTLEEMLSHLRPGGVYLCEDVLGIHNRFGTYVSALANGINACPPNGIPADVHENTHSIATTGFQRDIHSVHLYPYVAVIEKCEHPKDSLVLLRRGTEWLR